MNTAISKTAVTENAAAVVSGDLPRRAGEDKDGDSSASRAMRLWKR
jgi:hypothetical protein